MERITDMLELYTDREKIVRLLQYMTELMAGLTKNRKLATFSSILSECRTTMRLFDGIPMLSYSLSYGLGNREPDLLTRVCSLVVNLCDTLYYPLEHVAWAADKGLVGASSERWWTMSNVCYTVSLYFSIIRSLRQLHLLQEHVKHLNLSDTGMRAEFGRVSQRQLSELVWGVRCVLDMVLAVHCMPQPWVPLAPWQVGAIGTASSVLALAQGLIAHDDG